MNKQQLAAKIWESANKMRSKKDGISAFKMYVTPYLHLAV